jgi:(R,R)-butanediol dehydrogenase/meso-butanediol dehydrogenase/diacetyl reductase
MDMGLSMAKELDIRFTMTYEPEVDFPATLAMLASGAFRPDVLISDHIPLERLVEDGLEELLHHADQHVKILVDPS